MKTQLKITSALRGLLSGLLLLAAGTRADAVVIYSGANQNVVNTEDIYHCPISLFGSPATWDDLNVRATVFGDAYWILNFEPSYGSQVRFALLSDDAIKRFGAGVTVDGSLLWPVGNVSSTFSYYDGGGYGEFLNATGYTGIRMTNGPDVYYGWMQVAVANYDNTNITGTLIDWAYQSTPNTAILTGDIGSSVPEPSRALLLLGGLMGMMLRRWRR